MRIMIRLNALKSPISTTLLPVIQMTSSKLFTEVAKVLQSNDKIPLDQSFTIDLVAVRQPTGSDNYLKVLDYSKDSLLINNYYKK